MAPFYGWGSTVSRLEPLWGGRRFLQLSSQISWHSFYRPRKDERLSQPFQISSLMVSGRALGIWSISTDLVLDQELLLACWYLIFLNIKVFLRGLFFSSSISLSNLLIVSNYFYWFRHFVLSFQMKSLEIFRLFNLALQGAKSLATCFLSIGISVEAILIFTCVAR